LIFGSLVNFSLFGSIFFQGSLLHTNDDWLTHYLQNQVPKKAYWVTGTARYAIRSKEEANDSALKVKRLTSIQPGFYPPSALNMPQNVSRKINPKFIYC